MGMRNISSSEIHALIGNVLLCPALTSPDSTETCTHQPCINFIAMRQEQGECWVKPNRWCVSLWQLCDPEEEEGAAGQGTWRSQRCQYFPENHPIWHLTDLPKVSSAQPIPSKSTLQRTRREATTWIPPSFHTRLYFPGRTSWQLLSFECSQVPS